MRSCTFVSWLFVVSAAAVAADQGACIGQARYWGGDGPATHLVVIDGHALFGGLTLRVADLADPADPVVVHEVRLDRAVVDLDANDRLVYLVDGTGELTVIEASVPYRASVAGRYVPLDPFWTLQLIDVHGDLAVVGGQNAWSIPWPLSNLTFLDISSQSGEPMPTGSLEIQDVVESLAMGDGVAVATTRSNRILFIDVSDPAAPAVAAELDVDDLIVSGEVSNLAARDNLLAVSDTEGRVVLVDISIPAEPVFLALIRDLDIGMATVSFDGPLLHVAGDTCTAVGTCGGYALIDISAPRQPRLLGRLDGPKLTRPVPFQGHVMAAAFEAGLRVIDLRGLTNPEMLDATLPARDAGAFATAGKLAAVVNTTSLADPEAPERNTLTVLQRGPDGRLFEAGVYSPTGAIWAVAAGNEAVVAATYNEENGFHSVEVIDVADPYAPALGTRLGARLSINHDTEEPHLVVTDHRLFMSLEGSNHVLIYELLPGGRVRQLGDYRPGAPLLAFAAPTGDLLVVALRDGETGWIDVVDVRVPSSSVLAATFALPEPADVPVSLDGEGNKVVVMCRDFDGWVGPYNYSILLDVTEPTNPVLAIDSLPGGRWVAFGGGVLHTVSDTYPPSGYRHVAVNVSNPPDAVDAGSLGALDISRNRVNADGPDLGLSRGRLEVRRFGDCRTLAATSEFTASPQ